MPFFLKFSILDRVVRVGTTIFFSFFLDLSRPVLAWNEAWRVFFNFLNFFALFFGIFYSRSGRMDRNNIFFSLFLEPVLAWNHAWMVFFNFFAIFLEFSIQGRVGRIGAINFFLSFSTCPDLFWLEMKPELCMSIFSIFLLFFFFRNFLFLIE